MNLYHGLNNEEQVISSELDSGERILWLGRPDPRRATLQTVGIWLFAIPWTAFSVFWMWGAFGYGERHIDFSSGESFFPLFGLPFVLIGVAMLLAPVWSYRTAQRTVHAVTDRRILTIVEGGGRKVTSYLPADITSLERKERADGSGNLIFGKRPWRDSDGHQRTSDLGLYGIKDVREVERIIRESLLKGGRPGVDA